MNEHIYVGSTCQPLSKIMAQHRRSIRGKLSHLPLYAQMQELGLECFFIELVEEVPCENIEQLRKIEGKYIRSIGTLNIHIAGRTSSEYAQDHKGRLTENRKLRYTETKIQN